MLSAINLTPNNSQAYEANLNVQGPLNVNFNDKNNIQSQIDKNEIKVNSETNSINNEYTVQKNLEKEQQNTNIVENQEKESINSLENSQNINNDINLEQSKSNSLMDQIELPDNSENNDKIQSSQEELQLQNEDSNSQEEQNLKNQKVFSNFDDQIHPINTPIDEIYGVDRNFRNDLIFTVRFSGYNKIERVTNQDMKKYHQPELIEFYEKCMTFCQPIDMPPYKPR